MEQLRRALAEAKAARLQGELVCEQLQEYSRSPAGRGAGAGGGSGRAFQTHAPAVDLRQELAWTDSALTASSHAAGIDRVIAPRAFAQHALPRPLAACRLPLLLGLTC